MAETVKRKNKYDLNKKHVIISGIVMLVIAMLFFVGSYTVFKVLRITHVFVGTVNYRYMDLEFDKEDGITRDEIIDRHGEFDIVIDDKTAGYSVSEIESGYRTKHQIYLIIYFDENDNMEFYRQEVFLND